MEDDEKKFIIGTDFAEQVAHPTTFFIKGDNEDLENKLPIIGIMSNQASAAKSNKYNKMEIFHSKVRNPKKHLTPKKKKRK